MKRRDKPKGKIMALNQDDIETVVDIEQVKTQFALIRHGIITGREQNYSVLILKA